MARPGAGGCYPSCGIAFTWIRDGASVIDSDDIVASTLPRSRRTGPARMAARRQRVAFTGHGGLSR